MTDPVVSRARKTAIIIGVGAFVLIFFGTLVLIYAGLGAPPNQNMPARLAMLLKGSAFMSGWIGLISYGVIRLVQRLRK